MPDRSTLYDSHPAMLRANPVGFILGCALCLVIVGIPIMLIWWLSTKGTRLTVTDEQTVLLHGILSNHTTEVYHDDVRLVTVSQGIFGRMLDTGDIGIATAGHAGVEIEVSGIPSPNRVKEIIQARRQTESDRECP